MPKHRVIGGHVVTTPEGVFAHYRPRTSHVPADVWETVRPIAVEACRAADYVSVASALDCMAAVSHFLGWAYEQDLPLDLESVFVPSHVERYCATVLKDRVASGRSTLRGYLRRVGRACTKQAPWTPPPKPFANYKTILPPYSPAEVDGFWDAAQVQSTEHRVRVASVMLTLGLGAGIKPGEMLDVTASQSVRVHPDDSRLVVVVLADRTVPVLTRYTDRLRDLCDQFPDGPLVGEHNPTGKDPLGSLRQGIVWPTWLPPFRANRLRTTWMAEVLAQDVRISEFMAMAGTVSSKSLEVIAPHVEGRWDEDAYLFKGAGL